MAHQTFTSPANSEAYISPQWLADFLEHVPALAFIKDVDGRYIYVNPYYLSTLQVSLDHWLGRKDEDLWKPDIAAALVKNDKIVFDSGSPIMFTERVVSPVTGLAMVHMVSKFPLYKDGHVVALGGIALDITEQKRVEQALRDSEERYRIIAEYTYDWETWVDPHGKTIFVSPSATRITGYPREKFEEDAEFVKRVMHPDDIPLWEKHKERLEGGLPVGSIDFRVVTPPGQVRWLAYNCQRVFDDNGADLGFRASARDITDRKVVESQLRHQALHDPLTNLPNRTLCLDRISQALERSKRRDNYHYGVIFLDVDRFKIVNDSLGHTIGDKLLIGVGQRLMACVRSLDTVARLGGDEFVVLLEEVGSVREAIRIARRIRAEIAEPFSLHGHTLHITASMGVVLSPALYERAEDMLRNANIAMHRAKDLGRNRLKVFNTRMLEEAVKLMDMETDLRKALSQGHIHIEYQPIVALDKSTVMGFEALARWNHPEKGNISPAEFIPVAEDSGLIIPLGAKIMEQACQAMAQWRAEMEHMRTMFISVNVSARQLGSSEFVDTVQNILKSTGMDPASLKLEITESVIMDNPEVALITLRRLKELGVKLCVDDFGTGYSSLSYLQRFPIDTLKVDQSFVSRMAEDSENLEIVRAVIALAHSLGLDVVAEGVELHDQWDLLSDLQCESGQGYLFSRPLNPAQALHVKLEKRK